MPDTTFSFRIGMKLKKWESSFAKTDPNNKILNNGNIIWSDREEFRTNKKHEMVGLPVDEQIKKQNALILKKPLPIYYALKDQDKRNYVLSIDQRKVERWRDTFLYQQHYMFTKFPLVFSNKSTDTLKYINMNCSWEDIYTTNISAVRILFDGCDRNFPYVITVAPRKSLIINVPIMYRKGFLGDNRRLKMGMSLQKYLNNEQLFDFDAYTYLLRPETRNLIWSNEILIN
jgi:hypothetical protein